MSICANCGYDESVHDRDGCWHCMNCNGDADDCSCDETCRCPRFKALPI